MLPYCSHRSRCALVVFERSEDRHSLQWGCRHPSARPSRRSRGKSVSGFHSPHMGQTLPSIPRRVSTGISADKSIHRAGQRQGWPLYVWAPHANQFVEQRGPWPRSMSGYRARRCRQPVPSPAARGPSPRPPACGWGCARRGRCAASMVCAVSVGGRTTEALTLCPPVSTVRAVCARTDLCEGRSVMVNPTATVDEAAVRVPRGIPPP